MARGIWPSPGKNKFSGLQPWFFTLLAAAFFWFFSGQIASANTAAFAQPASTEKFIARSWTKTEGLPNNSVTAVLQTHDGYLWVGTQGGLARFDGVAFKRVWFSHATNSDLWITDICEDAESCVWIGTDQGNLFCYTNNSVSPNATEVCALGPITSLAADTNGTLWIGTKKGLVLLDHGKIRRFTEKDGLPEESVSSVCVARSGKVWITTHLGVYLLRNDKIEKYHFTPENQGRSPEFLGVYEDRQHDLWAFGDTYLIKLGEGKRFNYFRSGQVSSMRIWSFHEGLDGKLWVGTSGKGLFQFTGEGFRPIEIPNRTGPNDVRSICEDREGNLWLGTDGAGLVQLRQEHVREFGAADGLPGELASCIVEDNSKNLLVAYSDGSFFSGDTEHFEPYKQLNALGTPPFIRAACTTPNGDLWLASFGAGLNCYHNHRRIKFTSANGLFEDFVTYACSFTNGDVWAGTQSGRLYLRQGENLEPRGSLDSAVTAMLASSSNTVWVGTEAGSLWQLQQDRLVPVVNASEISNGAISCLCQDPRGWLWAGTRRRGLLLCYGNRSKSWPLSEEGGGLGVFGITLDVQENLWLTTSKGIAMIERAELNQMLTYTTMPTLRWIERFDGNENANTTGPTSLLSKDGFLWFISAGKVIRVDPRNWRPQRTPPPVYIESVKINQDERQFIPSRTSPDETSPVPTQLPPGVHALDFEFTTPSFTLPERIVLRYKLEGVDADWISAKADDRRAHYGAVAPGNYCFRVIARNSEGVWNLTGSSFFFKIPTPLWRSPLALMSYTLVLAAGIFLAARVVSHRRLRLRLRKLEHSEEMFHERIRIAQDMHDEIGSKLAKISFLSEGVKTELQGIYKHGNVLDSLAKTSRDLLQSLDQMVWAVNPLNDTVENLAAYLCHHATDYFQNTPMACELCVPPELPVIPLSAEMRHNVFLAVEEVLTNAMKHSGATKIRIELSLREEILEISITDNGCGFEIGPEPVKLEKRNSRTRHGISGIRRRLKKLGGECLIRSSKGSGTAYTFKIPIKQES